MANRIDIHSFAKNIITQRKLIAMQGVSPRTKYRVKISKRNSELILAYDSTRSLEGIAMATRYSNLTWLLSSARLVTKDFDRMTKEDIKELVFRIKESDRKAWTKAKMRVTFKRFYKWIKEGDDYTANNEYPEEVRWIKKGLRDNDLEEIKESDCWTEEDINKLLASVTDPRDKAIISIITETGARIGELGSLRVGDVYKDEFSYLIHIKGKTGTRDARVLYSTPDIADWLNKHPQRDDPEAPLWIHHKTQEPLKYQSFVTLVKKAKKRAGINKKSNPHIYRHSRVTILETQGMPRAHIIEYVGWVKGTRMFKTYSHIRCRQANNFMLKAHGIKTKDKQEVKLKAQLCAICKELNPPENRFCKKCGRPLNNKAILKYNQAKKQAYDEMDKLIEKKPQVLELIKKCMKEIREEESEGKSA